MTKSLSAIAFACLALLTTSTTFATPSCKALLAFVGDYHLYDLSCDHGAFGRTLSVRAYKTTLDSGVWIESNGIELGISASSWSNSDSCTLAENGSVTVRACAGNRSCVPQGYQYEFLPSGGVIFTVDGCEARYIK